MENLHVPHDNLKIAPTTTGAKPLSLRAALAEAIAAVREAGERVVKNSDAITSLSERTWAAQREFDSLGPSLEEARQAYLEAIVDPSLREAQPEFSMDEARQRREAAVQHLTDLRAARTTAEERQRHLESSVEVAKVGLDSAIRDVVKDDPATRRLCDRYTSAFRAYVDMRRAVEFLRLHGALPEGFLMGEGMWRDLPGDKPWRSAFAELEKDANAELPASLRDPCCSGLSANFSRARDN